MVKYTTMDIKNKPFKTRKIPYYLFLTLLTVGASIILSFLSFGGMFAIYALLPLAFTSAVLSVLYEGEIYLQNLKASYNKLFKNNYLKNHLAKDFMLQHVNEAVEDENCPSFFKDYVTQLQLLERFNHKELDKDSKRRKKELERTLKDMEKWFALQLFAEPDEEELSPYTQELRTWLQDHGQEEWQMKHDSRRKAFHGLKAFSVLAGLFMGFGTTYLIVEAFSVIPFIVATIPFAVWPIIILPMAIIAGAAYGMLTYNACTNLINDSAIFKWFKKLRTEMSQGITVRNVLLAFTGVLLVGLALGLTICTAGTWWTIANNARPIFAWMSRLPSYVMGIINPIITGISAFVFIIENTGESLELVDEGTRIKGNPFKSLVHALKSAYHNLRATENIGQILNPFRILSKLIVMPLRILFFIGHLISVAVTADRVPGIPEIVAFLIAIISEGFEDGHYFFSLSDDHHDHEHGHDTKTLIEERLESAHSHSHDNDLPTRLLKLAAEVFYIPAAAWDSWFSRFNKPVADEHIESIDDHGHEDHHHHDHHHQRKILSFTQAWDKQRGIQEKQQVMHDLEAVRPSQPWQKEHTLMLIEKHKRKHLEHATFGKDIALEKIAALDALAEKARAVDSSDDIEDVLDSELQMKPVYSRHRMFAQVGKTSTAEFIEELPQRIHGSCAA